MNVVCLFGSPRKNGNSAAVAGHFLDTARKLGACTQSFYLNTLSLQGCQACNRCKTRSEKCVLKDDLSPVLEAVFAAEVVVMASPVYYGDVSAQLKAFIDRTYSYLLPGYIALNHPSRLPVRKQLAFILTQGHRSPDWFADILPRYRNLFHWTGFAETHPLRVVDVYRKGDVGSRQEVMQEAALLARKLLAPGNAATATAE
ncbi:MAG TPA: flavodoxin family protein [Desulfuromonadales bacterium]|nr:flavodoxin family protein [Desulfuromonadales bacterium]